MRRRPGDRKPKRPRTAIADILLIAGIIITALGVIVGYIICVDRAAEFLNGFGYQNKWFPEKFGFAWMVKNIPQLLYVCVTKYLEASFASALFFPLVILLVPLTDAMFFNTYVILLYCYVPVALGSALIIWAIVFGERKAPSRRKR